MYSRDQEAAARWLAEHSGLLLALPGSGKTRTVLRCLENTAARAVIAAPASVIQYTWQQEAQRVNHPRKFKIWRPGDRIRDEHILVSYNRLPNFLESHGLNHIQTVVFDEVSLLRNPRGVRWRAINTALHSFPHKIGLTGTPVPNHLYQLWGQLQITAGMPLLYEQWLRAVCIPTTFKVNGRFVTHWRDDPTKLEAVYAALQPRSHELPELDRVRPLVLNHWVDTQVNHPDDGLVVKQQQRAQGRVYTNTDNDEYKIVHRAKLLRLAEVLCDLGGRPTLVFYLFDHDISAVEEAARLAGLNSIATPKGPRDLERDALRWNNGELELLILHPYAAGFGLNLQYGGSQIIWYALPQDAEIYKQGNSRIFERRDGSTRGVVHRIVAKNSIDAETITMLRVKGRKANSVFRNRRIS